MFCVFVSLVDFIIIIIIIDPTKKEVSNFSGQLHCEAFMDETFEQALEGQKVGLVRADSGFYTEKILNCLEACSLDYIIAVRRYPNIKRSIYGLKEWVTICDGIDVCAFTHQSQQKGAKPRRHFGVQRIERRPEAGLWTRKLLAKRFLSH